MDTEYPEIFTIVDHEQAKKKKGKRSSLTKNTEDVLVIRSLVANENYVVVYAL